jgi:hypothetical protein
MKRLNQKLESEFRRRLELPFFEALQEVYRTPSGHKIYDAAMQKWPPELWQMFSGQLDIGVNQQLIVELDKLGKRRKNRKNLEII